MHKQQATNPAARHGRAALLRLGLREGRRRGRGSWHYVPLPASVEARRSAHSWPAVVGPDGKPVYARRRAAMTAIADARPRRAAGPPRSSARTASTRDAASRSCCFSAATFLLIVARRDRDLAGRSAAGRRSGASASASSSAPNVGPGAGASTAPPAPIDRHPGHRRARAARSPCRSASASPSSWSSCARRSLRRPIGTAVELLAGIPAIVYGMWGLFVFAPLFARHVQPC